MRTLPALLLALGACRTARAPVIERPEAEREIEAPADPDPPETVLELAIGSNIACVRTNAGRVWCWGEPPFERTASLVTDAEGAPVGALRLAAGRDTACAIVPSGGVACWGSLRDEDGRYATSRVPRAVVDVRHAEQIAVGLGHACAKRRDGAVECWGENTYGQLGDGTDVARTNAAAVRDLSEVVTLDAGEGNTCAVTRRGEVWCWGFNARGQLGDNTNSHRALPVAAIGLPEITTIALGSEETCAIDVSHEVWCSGLGPPERKGLRTTSSRRITGTAGAISIAIGAGRGYAVRNDGSMVTWGDILAIGPATARPVAIRGIDEAAEVGANGDIACALSRTGAVGCWTEIDTDPRAVLVPFAFERPG